MLVCVFPDGYGERKIFVVENLLQQIRPVPFFIFTESLLQVVVGDDLKGLIVQDFQDGAVKTLGR